MPIDSRKIAKNTIFLYARMLLSMGVSLYTSRVVLKVLGEDDFGLFVTVYSVIGMLSFLTGTLSGGTSRFITFELGKGNLQDLKVTFSTALLTHIFLGVIIIIIGETIGLWYVYDVLKAPEGQRHAVIFLYQLSIVSTVISIIQIPFSADIIAHEKMSMYAYMGIFDVCIRLGIVYLLLNTSFNKLILYGWLLTGVSALVFIIYLIYCKLNFKEIVFKPLFSKTIFKSMLGFSGWNLLANITNTLGRQGVIMLFNYFFSPVVVTAQAISNQISNAASQFTNNIRQAVNPQIIKLYAEGSYEQSADLTLKSAEYIYYLLLMVGVPVILVMPKLLSLWLTEVPEYSVAFARLMVLQLILDNYNASFYVPLMAANKINKNAIIGSLLCGFQFIFTWLLFKFGLGPLWARYCAIFTISIFSFVIKPYLLYNEVKYPIIKILNCLKSFFKITIPVVIINIIIYIAIPQFNLGYSILVASFSILSVLCCSYFIVGENVRKKIHKLVKQRFSHIRQ